MEYKELDIFSADAAWVIGGSGAKIKSYSANFKKGVHFITFKISKLEFDNTLNNIKDKFKSFGANIISLEESKIAKMELPNGIILTLKVIN